MENNNNILNVTEKIEKIYKKITYFSKYGFDVWISIMIVLIFLILVSYFNIINHIQPIRKNWVTERCKPEVMPFAGIINPSNSKSTSGLEFTQKNFVDCQQNVLDEITGEILSPFNNQLGLLGVIQMINSTAINDVRGIISVIRDKIGEISKTAFAIIAMGTIPVQKTTTNISDMSSKTMGILSALLNVVFGTYDLIVTSFLMMDKGLIRGLEILAGMIAAAWIMPWTWGVAAAGVVFMCAVLVFVVPTHIFMNDILNVSTGSTPGVPGKPACFTGDTKIKMRDGSIKEIKDIEVNDVLIDNSTVTSTLKLSSKDQEMYQLFDMRISGKHRIFDEEVGWISIDNHPQNILIEDFREPYLYCLNTNTKILNINNHIFLDWDDLDELNLMDIRVMCVNNGLIPKKFERDDIHKYLDCGLVGETMIELEDGQSVFIKDVEVNDVLRFGEQVQGIVKTKADDMFYLRDFKNENLKGSGNVSINDPEIGVINTSYLTSGTPIYPDYIYNLITDTGFYHVNGVRIGDYNSGLDQFLHYSWN